MAGGAASGSPAASAVKKQVQRRREGGGSAQGLLEESESRLHGGEEVVGDGGIVKVKNKLQGGVGTEVGVVELVGDAELLKAAKGVCVG